MKTFFLSCLALSGLMLSQAEPEPEQDRSLKVNSCSTFSFVLTSDDTNCDVTKENLDELTHLIQDDLNNIITKMDGDVLFVESIDVTDNDPKTRRLGRRLGYCNLCPRNDPGADRVRHLNSNGLRHSKADRQRQLIDAMAQVLSDPEFLSTVNTDVFESTKFCATGIEFN
uniref:Uncharacterized protein n=1 Tax=Attheya septentrionalis TaxID=420275 RepID=A0A7S2UKD7_9STRA|mmetsp:Transcript_26262/g.47637  ORF Transcript_26262/g.47637 Transcript_26262/m.47637 type:complete len:170 (+) Transcript_26262:1178-1687(+)